MRLLILIVFLNLFCSTCYDQADVIKLIKSYMYKYYEYFINHQAYSCSGLV